MKEPENLGYGSVTVEAIFFSLPVYGNSLNYIATK
jgi:hypothetical protein